jgi:fumarylacetoacetate (FAA) hydrolase
LRGPCAPLFADARHHLDFAAALTVVTGDIPRLASPGQALDGVRLLMLANHVQVCAVADAAEAPSGDSLCCAFSPVAVTPDELVWSGISAWQNGRLNLNLQCKLNGRSLGRGNLGGNMGRPFGELLAGLCQSRRLCAGSIVSSGEVRFADAASGFASLAARRAYEWAQSGVLQTPWLTAGDTLLLDVTGPDGQSVFGAIAQAVSVAA